jgi:hypothetical protein
MEERFKFINEQDEARAHEMIQIIIEVQQILSTQKPPLEHGPELEAILAKAQKGEITPEQAFEQSSEIGRKEGEESTKNAFREVYKKHGLDPSKMGL